MTQEIEAPTLAAYCHLKGLKVTRIKKYDGQIVFHIEGDVEAILLDLSHNNKPTLYSLWDWD